jgi:hypothetical protein
MSPLCRGTGNHSHLRIDGGESFVIERVVRAFPLDGERLDRGAACEAREFSPRYNSGKGGIDWPALDLFKRCGKG